MELSVTDGNDLS